MQIYSNKFLITYIKYKYDTYIKYLNMIKVKFCQK